VPKKKNETPLRGFFTGCILQSQLIPRPRTSTMKSHGAEDQPSSGGTFFPHHTVGCLWQTSHKPNTLCDGWQTLSWKWRRSTSEALVSVMAHP